MERTNYMQRIVDESWVDVLKLYLKVGDMIRAWEEVISGRLALDYKNEVSEADVILQSTEYDSVEAARLVIKSTSNVLKECFDVEYQYQMYLQRVNLREEDIRGHQMEEMRQTFFAAFGVFLTLLMNQIQNLTEKEAEKALQSMLFQVGNFFTKKSGQLN